MQCKDVFVFKSIEKRGAGSFKNEAGEEISYPETYLIKVDENHDGKIDERKFKFSAQNEILAAQFKEIAPYEKIEITFDVLVYQSGARIQPVGVELL